MREQDLLLGVKRAIPDAQGNWQPLPAYEGWFPEEPVGRSGWWIWAGCVALVALAVLGLHL